MNYAALARIALSFVPYGGGVTQILAEIESAKTDRRLEILENPLREFGPDAKPLCQLLYDGIGHEEHLTNQVPWTDAMAPYLKTLNRFEAHGMVESSPVIGGGSNFFLRGVRMKPSFIVYLAMIGGDGDLCRQMSEFMDRLEPGKGITGVEVQKNISLPISVVDAFFSVYETEGQGLKSKEIGASYYVSK